jgi:ComF family protein
MKLLSRYAEDFFSLFFPQLCPGCRKSLYLNESVLCTNCIYHLPYTNYHVYDSNPVSQQLWGRIPLVAAYSFLHFQKGLRVQNLIHQLKYNHKPEVGYKLGELYGSQIKDADVVKAIDCIIPVPLHRAKKKKRGYNQSEEFAKGLSSSLGVPIDLQLKRSRFTDTQTRKSRFVRYENMKDVFEINDDRHLVNKHVLLVDDVITTGATLEACALELLKVSGLKVSIATIAFAT